MIHIAHAGPDDLNDIRALFLEYAHSLAIDLEYQGFPAEVASLPGAYGPPGGTLLLARHDGVAAGCVGVRRIRDAVCEMKRLYVPPAHRGSGIGVKLVQAALQSARSLGYAEMWLDTLPSMTEAHRLYLRLGFHEIAPYGERFAAGTKFFGLDLWVPRPSP